jgi:hypothetical protein
LACEHESVVLRRDEATQVVLEWGEKMGWNRDIAPAGVGLRRADHCPPVGEFMLGLNDVKESSIQIDPTSAESEELAESETAVGGEEDQHAMSFVDCACQAIDLVDGGSRSLSASLDPGCADGARVPCDHTISDGRLEDRSKKAVRLRHGDRPDSSVQELSVPGSNVDRLELADPDVTELRQDMLAQQPVVELTSPWSQIGAV